jgi:D-alanine-D-alanine ligase
VDKIISQIGLPLFAKPSSLGSSVGVFKCETKKELAFAIKEIFDIDKKILIEQAVVGREIECSVLGLEKPIASLPGEIQLQSGFYSYDAKYISDSLAVPISKAALSAKTIKEVQKLAIKTFQALECEIMTRVDFFLKEDGELIVNEINTLPGFTSISMYPKMLENTGIKYIDLLSELISLAIERKNKQ